MRGGDQGDSGGDADPIANGDISAVGQLFDNEKVVGNIDITANREATPSQQAHTPARKESVPGPPLQDFFPEAPREAHELSHIAVKAGAETRHAGGEPRPDRRHCCQGAAVARGEIETSGRRPVIIGQW